MIFDTKVYHLLVNIKRDSPVNGNSHILAKESFSYVLLSTTRYNYEKLKLISKTFGEETLNIQKIVNGLHGR
jgi:hypothetical protein